jgi:hypothetical protein
MIRIRAWAAVAVATLVIGTTGGCMSNPAAHPAAPPPKTSAGETVNLPAATAPASGEYKKAAAQAAAALLASFTPPSGAKAETGEPAGSGAGMTGPILGGTAPDFEQTTGWWVVAENPGYLEHWVRVNLSKDLPGNTGFASEAAGYGWPWTATVSADISTIPLYGDELDAEVGTYSGGKSVLRMDAVAYYRPMRTAAENISNAKSLKASLLYDGKTEPGDTTTVTDRSQIVGVEAVINALPAAPDTTTSCPDATYSHDLLLVFQAGGPGGAAVQVDIGLVGCGGISVTVGAVAQPYLSGSPAAQVLSILGVHWNLTSTSPPYKQG